MQRREVLYQGRVQGVGFRYTARAIARRYAVGGFVRNLPDGCVQLVVEGPAAQLDAFLAALAQAMDSYIVDMQLKISEPTAEFGGFAILH